MVMGGTETGDRMEVTAELESNATAADGRPEGRHDTSTKQRYFHLERVALAFRPATRVNV